MKRIGIKKMKSENSILKKQAKLTKGYHVLDIGFAQNPNIYLKGKITGIDIQKVKKPWNYKKIHQINLNKHKIPYKNNTFSTVILGSVLEHVENPSRLLRESNRVLKEYCQLIVTVPHANDPWTTIHNVLLPFIKDQDKGEHLTNWTRKDMIRLLERNGFKVNEIYGTFITIPKTRIKIPTEKGLKMLGWNLIYDCTKIKEPDKDTLTRESKNGKHIRVKVQERK